MVDLQFVEPSHNYAWLLKTDGSINYTAVNLRTPVDSQTLNIFDTYQLPGIQKM